jgi:DNA polymerase I-like protein with 3'-5' exonuclease and polymerase domains
MAIFSCDIETDGLNPTKVWCIVAQDVRTKEKLVFTYPDYIHYDMEGGSEYFNDWVNKIDTLVFHNGIGFDIPVLKKLLGTSFDTVKIEDTLIISQLDNPRIDKGHSLASWGERLGFPKGDHTDWSVYSKEMLKYCIRDVEITTKLYNHFNLSSFSRDAIELEYKIKEYCSEQEKDGWYFNEDGAIRLLQKISGDITEVESEVREVFKPLPVFHEVNKASKYNDSGSRSVRYKNQLDKGCHWTADGKWGYNTFDEFNLGSRQQIAKYLMNFGWEPRVFTDKGNVKVDETILENVEIPEAKLIARYLMLQKRRSMLESWLDAYNEQTHCIHARVHTIGTVTNRMSSSAPNLQQVVASDKEYGTEMRSLFTVPTGKVIVGADLSGLELRCLAHYMKDEDYINEILTGDIHTKNQKSAGLKTRSEAKRFIYAYLYGGGDKLIGNIVGGSTQVGRRIKKKFLDNTPALRELRRLVEKAADRGYLKGLDGRKILVVSKHSALNFLLQSAGAVVAKRAWVIFHEKCTLPYKQLGVIHDEIQIECLPEHAIQIGKQVVSAMRDTTDYYNLRCPIDGEYKIGRSWDETH